MFIFKVSLLLVSLTYISCNALHVNEDSIKLTLVFEGLCPGCHEFINTQLYPNVQNFTDYLKLDLIPLGHATYKTVDGKIEWTCEHGPTECYVNNINACFVNLNKTQTETVEFLYCFLNGFPINTRSQDVAQKAAVKCAKDQNVAWDTIEHCLENEADKLQVANKNRETSLVPPPTFVPNIRINDVYNATVEYSFRDNFSQIMCTLLNQKPKVCTEKNQ